MGESSARSLRGEIMTDVIFSGSSSRKPVGAASVELVFDNREGRLGGEYAGFGEISVKRTLSRDGSAEYALNGSRCRRRDITDVFLGTGLSSRSYAIMEQGMVSKLIDAKPEELKVYLEEAAGISKYKERRRETGNRIRHTRENLARLTDLREELGTQLKRLQRQSEIAAKYETYQQDKRKYHAELLALRWQDLNDAVTQQQQAINKKQNTLEQAIAEQRALEADIEKARQAHSAAGETMNDVQQQYYQHDAEITRLEDAIKHSQQTRRQQQQELQQLDEQLASLLADLEQEQQNLRELEAQIQSGRPQLQKARQQQQDSRSSLHDAESAMQHWQQQSDANQQQHSQTAQTVQVETTRMEHISRHIAQHNARLKAIQDEQTNLGAQSLDDELHQLQHRHEQLATRESQLESALHSKAEAIAEQRADNAGLHSEQDELRDQLQQAKAELAALSAAQSAALGGNDDHVSAWLHSHGLAESVRLAQALEVDKGWEKAVEAALGDYLEAVCVDDDGRCADDLQGLQSGRISLIKKATVTNPTDDRLLLNKAKVNPKLGELLHQVYAAEDLSAALSLREQLPAGAVVVTRDGICLGKNHIRLSAGQGEEGILQRQQHIKRLQAALPQLEEAYTTMTVKLEQGRTALQQLEKARDATQRDLNALNHELAESKAEINSHKNARQRLSQRAEELQAEAKKITVEQQTEHTALAQAQQTIATAKNRLQALAADRQSLASEKAALATDLKAQREQAERSSQQTHQLEAQVESLHSQKETAARHCQSMQKRCRYFEERKAQLQQPTRAEPPPLATMQTRHEALLQARQQIEAELAQARDGVAEAEARLKELQAQRQQIAQSVQAKREQAEQARIEQQARKVRCETLTEQLLEYQQQAEALLQQLDPKATEQAWSERLQKIDKRIASLGAVNLVAIDEHQSALERKQYLDRQNDDLNEALATLQTAMRKIDRETRTRLKTTYDQVNASMKQLFPRLFGGGNAYLELTGEDMLATGISIMARPPGKRNSSIHLLSGGEKAMTAIALLLAFFQLNPAPFCMLDEIDAALDDANIIRFSEVISEMSADIQFIVVTHSKMTMEMLTQLMGVTMQEAGVSRLVSVDIDEAVQLAS